VGTASQRVVVITGASSGIGRETARLFASQGAAVVLAARGEQALHTTAEQVTRAGGTALVVPTDVAVWPQVQHLAHAALERFGRIDVWVNNAAVSGYGELNTLPVEAIDRILDVDLRGQVYGVKAVLPILREQGHGTIIGVSSRLGVRAVPLMVPYCIAKAGVNALYEGLRLEERHAKSGVRVTTILPASIDTPFYDSAASWMGVRPARQQRTEPDQGQSNLTAPAAGSGAVDGGVVRFALPRSQWTRLVGFHPALARGAAVAATGAFGWRLAHRRPVRSAEGNYDARPRSSRRR